MNRHIRVIEWLETKKGFLAGVGIISVISAVIRFINIASPTSRIFDEVYSPVFAWKLLHGQTYFDIHPVLAELPHSIGLLLFGDTPLGWRFGPWLWGIVFCWAAAFAAYLLANRRIAGVIMALLVSLDTAYFVYGRTGLPDMFLLSQVALSITFFLLSVRLNNRTKATFAALVAGIFIGNVISTKWLGLAILGVIWSWIIIFGLLKILKRRKFFWKTEILLPNISPFLYPLFFAITPFFVYFLWLIPMLGWHGNFEAFWTQVVWWHKSVWNYNTTLTATHPYSSKWWQWPLVIHPVLFYWEHYDNGRRVINATGNVVLWWSALATLITGVFSLFRKFRPIVLWLIVCSLGFWLPWGVISRIAFNYHYFETLFFELLLISLILASLITKPAIRPYVYAFLVIVFISFVIHYPEASGMLVPTSIKFIPFYFPF